jgi:anion-transporting  ArsA/GET3 family ATPase
MMELQELFRDEAKSEFVVVTIASVLAVAESERLVKQLREQEVPVRHMVVSLDFFEKINMVIILCYVITSTVNSVSEPTTYAETVCMHTQ